MPTPRKAVPKARVRQSLWKGPVIDGITYSLLCKFIVCRERFRLKVVEGLSEEQTFNAAMEYGSMWHEAEEHYAANPTPHGSGEDWRLAIRKKLNQWREAYPGQESVLIHWYEVCKTQFPMYLDYWARNNPFKEARRIPLLEEVAFKVPYTWYPGQPKRTPVTWEGGISPKEIGSPEDGPHFTVTLRGKFDSVYMLDGIVWLQENKTKSDIRVNDLKATLSQNLQTMIYQVALRTYLHKAATEPQDETQYKVQDKLIEYLPKIKGKSLDERIQVGGTIYNVVKRPLADRHAIRRKKTESEKAFYSRLAAVLKEDERQYYFREPIKLTTEDMDRFKTRILHPQLTNLVLWWDSIKANPFEPWDSMYHSQTPWGVYNSIYGGYEGDYYKLLSTGVDPTLIKVDNLYPELS